MTKRVIFKRQNVAHILSYALCISFLFLLCCGEGHYSYSENGSLAFSIEWKDAPILKDASGAIKAASLDCGAAGVATVTFDVYSSSGTYLTGDSWPCSNHQGTVNGVPAGSNRTLVVSGEDSVGNVRYRGEKTGITVTAGQTTNVGTIQVAPVSPTTPPSTPTNVRVNPGNKKITISWNSVSGATGYTIYWATDTGVSKTNYEGVISDAVSPYTHTGLTNGTTYYYVVTAENSYGESHESSTVSATPISIVESLGMTFNLIPAGTFTMGSPTDEQGRDNDERQHQVTLTKPFYMQTTEVTQGQWQAIMGTNPSNFTNCGDNCPVERVSWNDCQEFINKLNQQEGTNKYRLPTEAEWEYACRAGSTTAFANGGITELACGYDRNLAPMGWYCYNSDYATHPVAKKTPNAWGLYDMHGNVWEWCQDWYGEYSSSPITDPSGPLSGLGRVLRGGCWSYDARDCRSADRGWLDPGDRSDIDGFRLARDVD
jgi:formylglycine-generating enzyme required for sulfatase activity